MLLTKENIVTLRNAERAAVVYREGKSMFVCFTKARRAGYDDSAEIRAEVELDKVRFWGRHISVADIPKMTCHTSSQGTDCMCALRTIFHLLKAGDEVEVGWYMDNNNQILTERDLHADECHLIVRRRNKAGVLTTLKFLVDYSVGLDNSARMIRRG